MIPLLLALLAPPSHAETDVEPWEPCDDMSGGVHAWPSDRDDVPVDAQVGLAGDWPLVGCPLVYRWRVRDEVTDVVLHESTDDVNRPTWVQDIGLEAEHTYVIETHAYRDVWTVQSTFTVVDRTAYEPRGLPLHLTGRAEERCGHVVQVSVRGSWKELDDFGPPVASFDVIELLDVHGEAIGAVPAQSGDTVFGSALDGDLASSGDELCVDVRRRAIDGDLGEVRSVCMSVYVWRSQPDGEPCGGSSRDPHPDDREADDAEEIPDDSGCSTTPSGGWAGILLALTACARRRRDPR